MKRSRILMVSDHSDPLASLGGEEMGGQNVYVHRLSAELVKRGFAVDVITRWSNPDTSQKQKAKEGYTVHRVQVGPVDFLPKEEFAEQLPVFADAVRSFLQKGKYDVLHSHYWLSGIAALDARGDSDIPLVHMFHSLGKMKHDALKGIAEDHMQKREAAERRIVRDVDQIIAGSNEERRILLREYDADPDRISVIPPGVDTTLFAPGRKSAARKKLNIKKKFVILYVGRFVAQKGIPTLLHAYAHLRNELSPAERRNTQLILVGGDLAQKTEKQSAQMKRLQKLVTNLGLAKHVRFAGKVENDRLPIYFRAADVCVVPSRYEPFGIVPLEAMACGTPVVASYVGGMKTTVSNLRTGFHARPRDVIDFAYKIRLLLQNENLRHDIGRQAREHVLEHYEWSHVTDRMMSCYSILRSHHSV